jgi:hypothetical protein
MEPSQVWVKERGFQKCRGQSSLQQDVAPIWQPHLHVQQTNKYFRYAQYHIIVDLETIIALATITFVVEKTCMNYILRMKKCLMILSMINKYFSSEKKFKPIF